MSQAPARPNELHSTRARRRAAGWAALLIGLAACSGPDAEPVPRTAEVSEPTTDAKPCDAWTLSSLRTARNSLELRVELRYSGPAASAGDWAYYALVVREGSTGPAVFAPAAFAAMDPPPRPLQRRHFDGHQGPVYIQPHWYDRSTRLALYLVRLPAPDPALAGLGLEVRPRSSGPLVAGVAGKHHGPLPPVILPLESVSADGLAPGALVCRARSPRP